MSTVQHFVIFFFLGSILLSYLERRTKRRGTGNDDEARLVDVAAVVFAVDAIDFLSSQPWLFDVSDFAEPFVRKQ